MMTLEKPAVTRASKMCPPEPDTSAAGDLPGPTETQTDRNVLASQAFDAAPCSP